MCDSILPLTIVVNRNDANNITHCESQNGRDNFKLALEVLIAPGVLNDIMHLEFILPTHLGHSVIGSPFGKSNLNQGALNIRQYFGVNVCAASFVGKPERKVDKKKSTGSQ